MSSVIEDRTQSPPSPLSPDMPTARSSAETLHLAESIAAMPLDAAVRTLLEMADLESLFEASPLFEALQARARSVMGQAFDEAVPAALREIHASLFMLYDLHVARAQERRAVNQFNPDLIRLRNEIERKWLAHELGQFDIPVVENTDTESLIAAMKDLWHRHPASHHPIFDFLEHEATREQLCAFFQSDSALNIRFFDLIVLSLLGSEESVRKELAQNFWDESGRGDAKQGHVALFRHLLDTVGIGQAPDDHASTLEWQGLAGYNLFIMTGLNRQHNFKSLGVMAMTELLDPKQYEKLARGCRRLGLGSDGELDYYDEHVTIDVVHGEGWLRNVIAPIVTRHPQALRDVLIGAQWRLRTCHDYYDGLLNRLMTEY